MRKTVKAEVTVTLEIPEGRVQTFDNDDLADVIRGPVSGAMWNLPEGIEVVAWQVWRAD